MQSINGYRIDDQFYHFINNELLPNSSVGNNFWEQFTRLISLGLLDVGQRPDSQNRGVSLLHPRYALKAINARWGSLYSALYHEHAIPHSAGLRTGQRHNVARTSRVIAYSRDFLDAAFPLVEGSHKDAVSYLVYFQNLMVTLADGSTVGLRNPSQFVAKAGPREDPQSLIFRNRDVHVEVRFDRNNSVGAGDMANIDDILVEAPARTVISCKTDNVADKCEVLRNLQALFRGTLKSRFIREGKSHTRRLNRCIEFTARDGGSYCIDASNPVALQLDTASQCAAVRDENGNDLPEAIVNTSICAMLAGERHDNHIALIASDRGAYSAVKPILDHVRQTSRYDQSLQVLRPDHTIAKDTVSMADTRARQLPCIRIEEKELKNTSTINKQNTAVLNAIQQSYLPH